TAGSAPRMGCQTNPKKRQLETVFRRSGTPRGAQVPSIVPPFRTVGRMGSTILRKLKSKGRQRRFKPPGGRQPLKPQVKFRLSGSLGLIRRGIAASRQREHRKNRKRSCELPVAGKCESAKQPNRRPRQRE